MFAIQMTLLLLLRVLCTNQKNVVQSLTRKIWGVLQ